jgi:hypothetical protein
MVTRTDRNDDSRFLHEARRRCRFADGERSRIY